MKKAKKILSVILSAVIVLGITSCSTNSNNPDSTTTATTTTASGSGDAQFTTDKPVDIDPTQPAGTIKWLMYEDLVTNDATNVALFESKYGGTVEQEMCASGAAYFEKLGTMISSGTSPDIVRYEWMSFPHGMSKNMYTALDSYIDMDSDLWKDMKSTIEEYSFLGKHFYYPYRISCSFALVYNQTKLEEEGIQDPMELYQDNEWTWDTFKEITTEWVDADPTNHIGYTGGSGNAMSWIITTGVKIINVTSDGQIINNMNNENVQRCMTFLEEMAKQNLIGEGYVDPGTAFKDGNLMFLGLEPTWAMNSAMQAFSKAGSEDQIAFLPFPRDPNSDTYTIASDTFGYLVPTGAKNVKGAVDWITLNREQITDPKNVAEEKEKALSTDPDYYPKCPNKDCGYNYLEHEDDSIVCPECGTARKEKFKLIYTEEQYEILQDMKSPQNGKFAFLFDNCFGFNADLTAMLTGGSTDDPKLLDGPMYHDASYTALRDKYYNAVEAELDSYRQAIEEQKKAS